MTKAATSDEEHDELVADGVRVDRATVEALVVESHFAHLQVPLLDVGPHQTEPRVVDDAPVLVRQRKRLLIQPRHLQHAASIPSRPAADPMGDTNKEEVYSPRRQQTIITMTISEHAETDMYMEHCIKY